LDGEIAKSLAAGDVDKMPLLMSIRLSLQNRLEAQAKKEALELQVQAQQRPYCTFSTVVMTS
jgi:hypothetical protein